MSQEEPPPSAFVLLAMHGVLAAVRRARQQQDVLHDSLLARAGLPA